jgi:hypothetical protein
MNGFTDTLYRVLGTTGNTVLSMIYTLYSASLHIHYVCQSSLVISWQWSHKSHCNFKSHMKSSFHSQIPFLPLYCNGQLNSISLLPSSYPSKLESRSLLTLLYNHFARMTQEWRRKQLLYCWEDVFTGLLHGNGSYSTVVCVFVAAGMRIPSRYPAINIYSDFTILTFGRHVTLFPP